MCKVVVVVNHTYMDTCICNKDILYYTIGEGHGVRVEGGERDMGQNRKKGRRWTDRRR